MVNVIDELENVIRYYTYNEVVLSIEPGLVNFLNYNFDLDNLGKLLIYLKYEKSND